MPENRRPVLVKGPVDSYIVRNHPVSLSCRALYAERISFKYNDEWVFDSNHEIKRGIDEQTKAVYTETRILVHKREVEEYFGASGFSCECYVYGKSDVEPGSRNVVKSEPATVRIAHFRKHFEREPVSDRQPLGGTVHIPCLPPEGEPRPQVFWLKDDREIEPRSDKNVIIAHDGALIIAIARLTDSGNYTCGARNIANQRISQTATVTIYVDGNWSDWSQWSGSCPSTCADADRYQRHRPPPLRLRYRQCNRPTPINGGRPCDGANDERQGCPLPCSVDGQWSDWSSWTRCQAAGCQRSRVRRCDPAIRQPESYRYARTVNLEPVSCLGRETYEFKNCSADACVLSKDVSKHGIGGNFSSQTASAATVNLAMMAGVTAAALVFLLAVLFLLATLLRYRRPPASKSASSSASAVSSTSCRRCAPSVYKSVNDVMDHLDLVGHCGAATDRNGNDRCETIKKTRAYATLLSSSDGDVNLSPTTALLCGANAVGVNKRRQLTTTTTTSSTLTYDAPPSLKSDRSRLALLAWPNHNADFSDNGESSPDHQYAVVEDPVIEDAQNQRNSFMSALIPAHFPRIWGQIGLSGGPLELADFGVSLYVPEGAISPAVVEPHDGSMNGCAPVDFLLAVCPDSPRLASPHQTFLSQSVLVHAVHHRAGSQTDRPPMLRKPLILSLEHCASDPQHWSPTLYMDEWDETSNCLQGSQGSPKNGSRTRCSSTVWRQAVTAGKETLNSAAFLHMENNGRCQVMVESFGRFSLVGEPVRGSSGMGASKRLRLLTFVSDVSLRVYCLPDTKASVQWALQQEDDLGGRLAADPEQRYDVRACGASLRLRLDDLRPQWRLKPGAQCQEIPRAHLWAAEPSASLHCAFTLESPSMANRHPTDYLSGRLTIDQTVTSQGNQERLMLDVDTSVDWPWADRMPERQTAHILPSTVKHQLASLLNPPLDSGNDWRMLANLLSIDSYLPYFASRPSPADLILSLWEAKSVSVDDLRRLIQVFHSMKREDAVQTVISCLSMA